MPAKILVMGRAAKVLNAVNKAYQPPHYMQWDDVKAHRRFLDWLAIKLGMQSSHHILAITITVIHLLALGMVQSIDVLITQTIF